MDPLIAGAVGLQQASTMSKIQFAAARRILDAQQLDGKAAIELIDAATQGVSQAGDQLAAAAMGVGGNLDVVG